MWKAVRWAMHEELRQKKTGMQHTTVVWYGGSCTNKHKLLLGVPLYKMWTFLFERKVLQNLPWLQACLFTLNSLSMTPWVRQGLLVSVIGC